jgi:hypothetical protein
LSAAGKIRDAAERTLAEVAKYAFSRGIEWKEIGAELGVGDTAVQKRFGADRGLSQLHLAQLGDENVAVQVWVDALHDEALLEDDGAEPRGYLLYGVKLIGDAAESFHEGLRMIQDGDPQGYRKIRSSLGHLHRATEVLVHRSTLDAIKEVAAKIPSGATEQYAPTSYMLQGIFRALLAFVCLTELHSGIREGERGIDSQATWERTRCYLEESLATLVRPGPAMIIYRAAHDDNAG